MDELHGKFTATGEFTQSLQQAQLNSPPLSQATINVDDSPVDDPPVDDDDPSGLFDSLNMPGGIGRDFMSYADILGGRRATPDTPVTPTATATDDSYTSEYDTAGRPKRPRDEPPRVHRRGRGRSSRPPRAVSDEFTSLIEQSDRRLRAIERFSMREESALKRLYAL